MTRRREHRGMERLKRFRRRLYNRIPMWIRRHDFEIFAALLCMSAGVPLLVTDQVDATSVEATLPSPLVQAWATVLAFAPLAVGLGLYFTTRTLMPKATFWMRVEAIGLRALAYSAYVYSVAIFSVNHLQALPALMIVLAFALTCHTRATSVTVKVEEYLESIGTRHV